MIPIDEEKKDEGHPRLRMPVLFEQRAVALHPGSHLGVRSAQPRHDEGVVSGDRSALERLQTQGPAVDRRVGFLQGLGGEGQRRDLPEGPFVGKGVLGPRPPDDLQGLVVARPALARVHAKALEVFGNDPASDPEIEAPAAQNIQHGEVLGLTQRIVKRQEADRCAQTQACGLARQRGEEELRARADAKGVEMFFPNPGRVVAQLLGLDEQVERITIIRDLVLPAAKEVEQRE